MADVGPEDVFAAAARFEKAWEDKLGGRETESLRFILGICIGRLIHRDGVDPKDLIAYITAVVEEDGVPPSPLKAV